MASRTTRPASARASRSTARCSRTAPSTTPLPEWLPRQGRVAGEPAGGRAPADSRATSSDHERFTAQLPARLARQDPDHLPRHRAVVRRGRSGRSAPRAIEPARTRPATRPRTTSSSFPDWGRNRMRGMLESRPDWCISRQRSWGLPIPAFTAADGEVLLTEASVRAVAAFVREHGSDAWFTEPPRRSCSQYDPADDPDAPDWIRAAGPRASVRSSKGGRHLRRLVRVRLVMERRDARARHRLPVRSLPRGLGPAPGLVPAVAAAGARHDRHARRTAPC